MPTDETAKVLQEYKSNLESVLTNCQRLLDNAPTHPSIDDAIEFEASQIPIVGQFEELRIRFRKRIIEWLKSRGSGDNIKRIRGDSFDWVLESRAWSLMYRDLFLRVGATKATVPLLIAQITEMRADAFFRTDRLREHFNVFSLGRFRELTESAIEMLQDPAMIKQRNSLQRVMEELITDDTDWSLFAGDDTPFHNRLAATQMLEPLLEQGLFDTLYADTIELEITIETCVKRLAIAAHRDEWISHLTIGEKETVALALARKNLSLELRKAQTEFSGQSPISPRQSGSLQQRRKGVSRADDYLVQCFQQIGTQFLQQFFDLGGKNEKAFADVLATLLNENPFSIIQKPPPDLSPEGQMQFEQSSSWSKMRQVLELIRFAKQVQTDLATRLAGPQAKANPPQQSPKPRQKRKK